MCIFKIVFLKIKYVNKLIKNFDIELLKFYL